MAMKRDLWLRIRDYTFDDLVPPRLADQWQSAFGRSDPSLQAFAGKISRKLGWNRRFALLAIREYKKFVYLGLVSRTSVTPPKIIDQVWHEHLLFTRGYRHFCQEVLRRDFDHNPELLPTKRQSEVYAAQYEATLALYQHEFNETPPPEIWGTPKFATPRAADAARRRERQASTADVWVPSSSTGVSGDDAPLHEQFGGGGGFSGGGSEGSWGDGAGSDGDASGAGDTGDSGAGDGGDAGGCSSSCGGD